MAEQMKPSGIDWIGDIPDEWDITKVRFVTKLRSEQGFYNSDDKYIGLENISSYTGEYISTESEYDAGIYDLYKTGDLLFSKLRPYLAKALIADDCGFCTGELAVIKEYNGDIRYLFYYMLSDGFLKMVDASTYGAKMPRASWDYIKNLQIPVIGKAEQQAIADFLDKECGQIDSIAADLEKQIALLQQYKKSLITETVTKGLDKSVPMKDSGVEWIGKIPAHWNFKRLKFMLENSSDSMKVGPFGSALSGSDFTDEGKWVYNQRVVLDNNFSENTTFVSEEKFQEMRSFAVYPGDILITTRGTIGKVAIVPEGAKEGILHPCIIKFRVDKEMIIPELLQLIFNESDFVKDQFTLMSNATTIEVIYSYSLKDILLPVIPADEQEKIYGYLSKKCIAIDGIISEKQKALATIIQHKKSLIYEYVTGKKRVKEVQ